ncbi:hypothetical protein A8M58_19090 [Yersinia pestis]|nr:hypothetical protein A8M58_19090 [Yersinia pestis]
MRKQPLPVFSFWLPRLIPSITQNPKSILKGDGYITRNHDFALAISIIFNLHNYLQSMAALSLYWWGKLRISTHFLKKFQKVKCFLILVKTHFLCLVLMLINLIINFMYINHYAHLAKILAALLLLGVIWSASVGFNRLLTVG